MNESKREEIALFRYGVILPFLNQDDLEWGMQGEILRRLAARDYDIPHSTKHTINEETIRKWLSAYKRKGFDGLKPKSREDAGKPRTIPTEIWEKAAALRHEAPGRSVRKIIQIMEAHSIVEPGKIKCSTLARRFKEHGLDRKTLGADNQVFRRFEAGRPNQIWQSDIMFGPYLPDPNNPGKNKRTYLVAFIDDYSRLVPSAEFYWDEKFPALENTFKKAMLRRGVPNLVYVDNGKVYSARRLDAVCASLGIRKIHSKPYSPEGRGKIERFFRTVRDDFLAEPEISETETLPELNRLFTAWLEVDYHTRTHSSTKATPLERWREHIGKTLKTVGEKELSELFLWQISRKVSKLGIVSVGAVEFEVYDHLKGKQVEIRYNPFDLAAVTIYYKEQLIQKVKPAGLAAHNTKSPKTAQDKKQTEPTGLKPLSNLASQHHQHKMQLAGKLTGNQMQTLNLAEFIKLIAHALGKNPEHLHPKEIDTIKEFHQQHPNLTPECAAVAMAKAVTSLRKDQHITRYLEIIKTSYLKRKEIKHE